MKSEHKALVIIVIIIGATMASCVSSWSKASLERVRIERDIEIAKAASANKDNVESIIDANQQIVAALSRLTCE